MSEPLNFSLAKPYPASAEIITCPTVAQKATIRLFKKYCINGIDLNTFLYEQNDRFTAL